MRDSPYTGILQGQNGGFGNLAPPLRVPDPQELIVNVGCNHGLESDTYALEKPHVHCQDMVYSRDPSVDDDDDDMEEDEKSATDGDQISQFGTVRHSGPFLGPMPSVHVISLT